jgi:hypothetical protein
VLVDGAMPGRRLTRREARRIAIDRACVENPLARGCM